jgi:hypothetical protein
MYAEMATHDPRPTPPAEIEVKIYLEAGIGLLGTTSMCPLTS